MSYEFTKLSDVPVVAEFPEGANAIIETNGEIKRCSSAGGGDGGVLIVNITNGQEGRLLVADKTVAEIIAAAHTQLVFAQYSVADTSGSGTPRILAGPLARLQTGRFNGVEKSAVFFAGYWYDSKEGAFVGGIMGMSENGVDSWTYYA